MKPKRFVWLLTLLFACFMQMNAQYIFRHWGSSMGLSDDRARRFTLKDDGRMMITTPTGIDIFNSATFQTYNFDRHKVYLWSSRREDVFKTYKDKDGLLWMKQPGFLALFDSRSERFVYDVRERLSAFGLREAVENVFLDAEGSFFFLTKSGKLLVTLKKGGALKNVALSGKPLEIESQGGVAYILLQSGEIALYSKKLGRVTAVNGFFKGKISKETNFVKLQRGVKGDLWLMYNYGIYHLSSASSLWQEVDRIEGQSNFFTDIDVAKDGTLWASTSWSGLHKIDARHFTVEKTNNIILANGSLLKNDIQSICIDPNGGLWLALLWQGICYWNAGMFPFKTIQSVGSTGSDSSESVRSLLDDGNGGILIGTTNHGLRRYDKSSGKITEVRPELFGDDIILCLYRDRQRRLWVGTYLNGLYCFDNGSVRRFNHNNPSNQQGTQNIARAVYEDSHGRIFVSVSNHGVGQLDYKTGRIDMLSKRFPEIAFHQKDFGFCPMNGDVLAVYGENGLYFYDTKRHTVTLAEKEKSSGKKFFGKQIAYNSVLVDGRQLEWYGTDMGVRVWDRRQKRAYTLTKDDGLGSNFVSSILQDKGGRIWIATINSISYVNVKRQEDGGLSFDVNTFDANSGLSAGRINYNAACLAQDGSIFIGAFNGTYGFSPERLLRAKGKSRRPILVDFQVFDRSIVPFEEFNGRVVLNNSLSQTDEIELRHNENFITLRFISPDFVCLSTAKYRFRLRGVDKQWLIKSFASLAEVNYTNLSPGKYVFEASAMGEDGLWQQPTSVVIRVLPPLWATWWAYLIYAMLLCLALYCLFREYNKRKQKRMEEELHKREEEQKERLNEMKFRFFTNISHEFRTPLTLIMTPLSCMIKEQGEPLRASLKNIYKNAEHLLEMINELLDFRRLEMGGEHLRLSRCEVWKFVHLMADSFQDIAKEKHITLKTKGRSEDELIVWLDVVKLRHILTNLLSNAFKFTPEGGSIAVSVAEGAIGERRCLQLEVEDTGSGISPDEVNRIFERFYQAESKSEHLGSGIGLNLVKQYVSLHEGEISCSSALGKGTKFTILLPMDLGKSGQKTVSVDNETDKEAKKDGKRTILVVEDNDEFREFLASRLSVDYCVLQAKDGLEGEKMAAEKLPDIIVSDLMMPVMDGLQMCQRLKKDISTSHIPVVMLTARRSDEARIETYQVGADSYISKPFNFDVLTSRLGMLIEKQEQRQQMFKRSVVIAPSEITITPLDEEYIKKAIQTVEDNIMDTDFSVNELSEALNMSRSQLYRKFESITGMSPSDFIRSIRLKRAAQLLEKSDYNVSEIADMTGFNSIRYFNQHFKEMFSLTPTQFRRKSNR